MLRIRYRNNPTIFFIIDPKIRGKYTLPTGVINARQWRGDFGITYFLQIINAPITPGTQAQRVRRKTIIIEPHPLSITARGGKIIQRITRKRDILYFLILKFKIVKTCRMFDEIGKERLHEIN